MILEQLVERVQTEGVHGSVKVEVKGLAYDSRQVQEGYLFVAVVGHQLDGMEFITDAVSRGACVVVSESALQLGARITHVQVKNARRALAELAAAFYGNLSHELDVIGVTGTNGKTTTTYMIRDLLRRAGRQPGLVGTVAYEIGGRSIPASRTTPESLELNDLFRQMSDAACDSAVMEVSSHAIALERVHGIDFKVAVFTNLTQDHLDFHGTMERYFEVKSRLLEGVRAELGRAVVVNADDEWGARWLKSGAARAEVITYGFDPEAMVCASRAKVDRRGTRFRVSTPWGRAKVRLKLLGRFNIHNALAALATGGALGLDLKRMVAALAEIEAIPGRLELIHNRKMRRIFVDYAHTDDALKNVLETLREICGRNRLILVFGCGGNRDRGKRVLMGRVAAALADYSVVTSDNPRKEDPKVIAKEILEGFEDRSKVEVMLDRQKAIERGIQLAGYKHILLIAGKGHETYQEVQGAVIPFDDREVVREILR
jgi:UDP-N-acetylmuramoyl-L-alanyl-D-glutamate--2,6-diaminopimelate ligase